MIWGKTYELRIATRNWFAWHPVRLKNGRWVWLEVVRKYWGGATYPEDGGWLYTLIKGKS